MSTVRVRFAPSPTGTLHIGGARTALFNWLFARHHGGEFLLRLEDTDRVRSTEESVRAILDAMEWLGLDYDEEPVRQSAREARHVECAQRLLAEGKAYKCTCTPDELAAMREKAAAEGRKPKYDGRCRRRDGDVPDGTPYTVRFKMPEGGSTTIGDHVLGEISVDHEELDDLIILRSDGTPTYNFVVVVDDADMGITHVIRGQDHVSNTFRQARIYEALGFDTPDFAHLPLVAGLSKRKGSYAVQHYRDQGFVAEAVINYIARLGWSHGDQELFSVDELIELFDLDGVNKASGSYDETKMAWVNREWIKRLDISDLAGRVRPFLEKLGIDAPHDERLEALVAVLRERSSSLVDLAEGAAFAYVAPTEYSPKGVKKWIKARSLPAFLDLIEGLDALETFDTEAVERVFTAVLEDHDLKIVKLAQPVRIALTGTPVSPPIYETIQLVGREQAVARMRAAIDLFPEG